jgi:AcrR family transcriptional regulator
MIATKDEVVGEYRRQTIQRAARRVMARRGTQGASMQAIADEARVAKGTLYLYFRDRDDLLDQAADGAFRELLTRLEQVLAEPGPLPARLRALVRTKIEFFDANQEFLRVYLASRYPDGHAGEAQHRRRRRPLYARYLEILTDFLNAAARRGELMVVDASRVALFLAEGVSAVLLRRLDEGAGLSAAAEVEWIVEMMLNGVGAGRRRR